MAEVVNLRFCQPRGGMQEAPLAQPILVAHDQTLLLNSWN